MGSIVYFMVKDTKPTYSSHTLLNTGLVTGYNLERSSSVRVDMNFAENEMGNLINLSQSNETLEDLALHLMAVYFGMPVADNPQMILAENWEIVQSAKVDLAELNIDFKQKEANLLENLLKYRNTAGENALKDLLFSEHPFFGLDYLKSHLTVRQEGRSDLLKITYSTLDPGVCQYTLKRHTELFVDKKLEMKEAQSKSVLEFFEQATQKSAQELRDREDDLLAFTVRNKIINYYEQTRYIAAEKEDLDDLYFKERMDKASSDSTLIRLEKELSSRLNLPELNGMVDAQRKELGQVHARLARLETMENAADPSELELLRQRAERLQNDMTGSADAILAVRRTPDGIQLRELLSEWLDRTLQSEITRARLTVFSIRKKEFDETYSRFAPWGSKLKRKEREINVAERAYLENLHSYNQALLHQFNTTLAGGLKVVDAPAYPAKAEGSNTKLMVLASFVVGMLLIFSMALALEIFDTTLKSPKNATEITQLPLAGALPPLENEKTNVDIESVLEKAAFQSAQSIITAIENKENQHIGIVSMQANEGKSFALTSLRTALETAEAPNETQLFEFPPLTDSTSKKAWKKDLDLVILVASANRVWSSADAKTLDMFQARRNVPIHLILTNTNPDYLEETIGEIPRYRTAFRKGLKHFLGKIGIK